MGVALEQAYEFGAANEDTCICTLPDPTGAGNLLLVRVEHYGATNVVTSVTDNKGNTYHRAGEIVRDPDWYNMNYELWYAYNITAGASHQVTVVTDSSQTYLWVLVLEASGFGAVDPYDQYAGVDESLTTPPYDFSFGTLTPRGPDAFLFIGFKYAFSVDKAPPGVFNLGLAYAAGFTDVMDTPAPYAADFSGTASGPVSGILGIFLAAGRSVWVDVADFIDQEISKADYPGGVARVKCELWSRDAGVTMKARLVALVWAGSPGEWVPDASVGESAEVIATTPTDADFAVTLAAGTRRYRAQVMADVPETDLFYQGAGVVP